MNEKPIQGTYCTYCTYCTPTETSSMPKVRVVESRQRTFKGIGLVRYRKVSKSGFLKRKPLLTTFASKQTTRRSQNMYYNQYSTFPSLNLKRKSELLTFLHSFNNSILPTSANPLTLFNHFLILPPPLFSLHKRAPHLLPQHPTYHILQLLLS